ncbi:MAG: hypothetical protein M3N82_11230 [Pseudomonadota bacterium]|nr:hypothetical protein [Pseudomonadota bacterium]
MPKVPIRKSPDSRTLVDRLLDRVKNNRWAAAIIIACLGTGALASLTDSTRKLGEAFASFGNRSVAGQWKSDAAIFYLFSGSESMRLYLQQPTADQVIGSVQFSGGEQTPRAFRILEGKRSGKSLTLSFEGWDGNRETVTGEVAGNELRLVHHRQNDEDIPVVARRVDQATQLVDGRLGIVYKGTAYPDHRTACVQLLKDLDPPQTYKLSEVPDESGNVHCVGQHADGSKGFDMFQNDVQRQLICPARSRVTLIEGKARPTTTKGCECEGELAASGGQCVPRS